MRKTIKDICEISTGVYEKPTVGGTVFYIQSRDFNDYLELGESMSPELQEDPKLKKHYLRKGDILVAAKGGNYFAAVFNEEIQPAVASSTFIVLRGLDKTQVLLGFLAWFLNHPKTQLYLSLNSKGSNISYISKTLIMDMEIDLPSLETQQRILEIHQLRMQEKKLVHRIEALKEIMINEKLIRTL
ncbi:MAG: restriction endonuclease subunit S [Flavobacteriaceae bacterium]|nr:restriction endonuclease subunit S [Flavobacteriaceae bacterium]